MAGLSLDSNGFIKVASNGYGLAMVDPGEMIDLIYQRLKTEKWYIMFFPINGFDPIYSAIEETFYKPKSGKNKGFEIVTMFDRNTILIMCYKEWMSSKELTALILKVGSAHKNMPFSNMKDGKPLMEIEDGKDIMFVQAMNESKSSIEPRLGLWAEVQDYFLKQVHGR